MKTDNIQTEISSIISRRTSLLTGFGIRILVHTAAIGVAVSMPTPFHLSMSDSGGLIVLAYIGFICLIPRGIELSIAWLLPTCLGVFQCLLWTFLGVPWQFTIIWGGILTWLVRLLSKRGRMGWEWAAAPWLIFGVFGFYSSFSAQTPVATPLWTLPVLALGGWGALLLYTRLNFGPIHRKMLANACLRLERQANALALPEPLLDPVRRLFAQGRDFNRILTGIDEPTADLIRDIDTFAVLLTRRGRTLSSWSDDTRSFVTEASRLNDLLSGRLREFEALAQSVNAALAARIEEFRQTVLSLTAKKSALPPEMQVKVDGIAKVTGNILTCMRSDPQDVAPADKFLSRYLTAAHTVVDEYARLSHQGSMHESITQALARSGDLLDRLEKAFIDEHGRLLQNDTVNFTAELNVLDKLLKMEGR